MNEYVKTAALGQRKLKDRNSVVCQSFAVTYEYIVAFTRGLFDPENTLLAEALGPLGVMGPHKCLVYIDAGVAQSNPGLSDRIVAYFDKHAASASLAVPPFEVAGGENVKADFERVFDIYRNIKEFNIDRHSYVIAIGGGAVLDAVGLAAATSHRGVRHIRVPTTVLSQNDSGVGVKNGVNFEGSKNFTGAFAPPSAVLNDLDLLASLPSDARREGISEAVKVALIRDGEFFLWLEDNCDALRAFEPDAEEQMIRRSAQLHMNQIARGGDPFEAGSARPLDFGHWSAHKLEILTAYEVSHGAAVAIGIALDARYSVLAGLLQSGEDERIARLLEGLGLELWHPALKARDTDGRLEILKGLQEFREHLGGELTVTLISDLGVGVEVNEMDPGLVSDAITWLATRGAR
ncbi:MAG: 3-dehydroquinate synthase [Pseudomonadota bacterium]